MNKISRPLLIVLAVVLVIAALGLGLAITHEGGGMDGTLMLFNNDMSDSALGWAIAIPILLFVGAIVIVVLAGAALVTVVALVFAAVITVLALMLAMTPFAIFLAIPVLAIYGLVKLFNKKPAVAA